MRWLVLLCLDYARPVGCGESLIASTVQQEIPDLTLRDVRLQLDYLEERKLVKVTNKHQNNWHAELSRYGIDIVEYTVECEPGIARPNKLA